MTAHEYGRFSFRKVGDEPVFRHLFGLQSLTVAPRSDVARVTRLHLQSKTQMSVYDRKLRNEIRRLDNSC